MNPNADTNRNSLKRPRIESPDPEPDCPLPAQRGVYPVQEAGSNHPVVAPYSSPDGLPSSSSSAWPFQDSLAGQFSLAPPIPSGPPLAINQPIISSPSNIPNYEWPMRNRYPATIPVPPQMLASNLSIHHTQTTANPTYISGGNNIENSGTLNFYQRLEKPSSNPDRCLSQLSDHASANAIHTSAAVEEQDICIPGFEEARLRLRGIKYLHVMECLSSRSSKGPDLIWLRGGHGPGKSTIMRDVAYTLEEDDRLLGSFFFSQADATRNTSTPFVPTMALQSFTSFPETRAHIRNTIDSQPTIFSQSTRRQFHALLNTPIKLFADQEPKWTAQSPLVFVVDGLDECNNTARQVEIIQSMRQLASTIRSSTNRRIKILIASRPEKAIQDEFERDGSSTTIIDV